MTRMAVIQCICPHYRIPLFNKLAQKFDLVLYYGQGEREGNWQNAENIEGFKSAKVPSIRIKFYLKAFPVRLVWFPTLLFSLHRLKPDLIISEGITNFINDIFIWCYCKLYSVPLILWDSGRKNEKRMSFLRKIAEPIVKLLFNTSDAVIAYSTIAKNYLISIGTPPEKIFIAQNSIDIQSHISNSENINKDQLNEFRNKHHLQSKKIILYVGSLEKNKKIDSLIKVFRDLKSKRRDLALILVGEGSEKANLEQLVNELDIKDVLFTGKVLDNIGLYFKLCDILVLPGRGGLAINQAMAYSKPVIVGEGDGTEQDLVRNGENGYLVSNSADLKQSLELFFSSKKMMKEAGSRSNEIIKNFTIDNMVNSFSQAISYATRKYDQYDDLTGKLEEV